MSASLRPMMTMGEVYGPQRVYAPRAHSRACRWLSDDPALLDSLTGNQLSIVGAMPVVCSAGVATPAGLELLAEAGLEPAKNCQAYRGAADAVDICRKLAGRGNKLVLQHAHPSEALPPETQWIDPALLRYLNNKANLGALSPAGHVPRRAVVSREAFFSLEAPPLPFVLKAATDDSTGGGVAVMVCRTLDEVKAASAVFVHSERLVVEEFLTIRQNLCMHFAVTMDGTVLYTGFADQDVTEAGRYRGNWMRLGDVLPSRVVDVAREVVWNAASLGYRGIAGIDLAVTDDDRVMVVDLNFRVNGSTAAALLAPAIYHKFGAGVMRLRGFRGKGTFAELIAAARQAVRRGGLIPLGCFDPEAGGHAPQPPRLSGLVVGESEQDVAAQEAELAAAGLG